MKVRSTTCWSPGSKSPRSCGGGTAPGSARCRRWPASAPASCECCTRRAGPTWCGSTSSRAPRPIPQPALTSQVYEFADGELAIVAEFPTSGGTDVGVVAASADETQFIVTNSLSADVRFATDTVVYALTSEAGAA